MPFVVKTVFSHGAVEISDTKNENNFKVNGQRLKPFLESVSVNEMAMALFDPVYRFPLFHFYFMHLYISFIHWGQCMR